jgi:hypothetical protein
MNDTARRPRLGLLLGAESEHEADEFEELAARTLALLAVPVEPPMSLRASVLGHLGAQHTAADAVRGPAASARHRSAPTMPAAARQGILDRFRNRARYDGDTATVLAALDRTPDAHHATTEFLDGRATISVVSSARARTSIAVVSGLPPAPSGKTYQLWTIRKGKPRGAGTFDPDFRTTAEIRLDGRYRAADVVAITLEPIGGSKQPTTEPMFALQT